MDRWKDKSYTLQVPEIEVCSPELIKTIDSFLNDIKAKLDSINWQEDHMPVITLAISEEGNVLKKSLDADSNYAQIFEGASEDPRMTMFPTYGAFHEKGFQIRVSLTQPNLICKNCVPKGKEICPISYTSDSLELIVYEFQDRKGVVLYDNQFYFLRTI